MWELLGEINQAIIRQQALIPTEIVLRTNLERVDSGKSLPNPKNTWRLVASKSKSTAQRIVPLRDRFNYSGRIDWQDPQAPAFGFPGTAVEFKFSGTSLKLEISEDNWGSQNYLDVYLDDNPQPITIELRQEKGQPMVYDIAEGLENKIHKAV